MSAGVYALIGVVLGGLLQIGVQWVLDWRRGRTEWKVASRLVSEELVRLMVSLRRLIEDGRMPGFPIDERFLSTSAWEEFRTVFARQIPDDGDNFWGGIAAIHTTTSHLLRPMLEHLPPGAPLPPGLPDALRDGFDAAWGAYEAMTGTSPPIAPPADPAGSPGTTA